MSLFQQTEAGRGKAFIHKKEPKRLYKAWIGMKERCHNLNHLQYKEYGGRGIKVCQEWRHNFIAFRDWALANGYNELLIIDRRENNEGYSPDNCRWVTYKESANNRRSNKRVMAFGETKILSDWINDPRCKVNYNTLCLRLRKDWTAERALITPSYR